MVITRWLRTSILSSVCGLEGPPSCSFSPALPPFLSFSLNVQRPATSPIALILSRDDRRYRKLELNRRLKYRKVTDRLSQQCHYTFPSLHPRCCRHCSRRLRFTRTRLTRKKNVGKQQADPSLQKKNRRTSIQGSGRSVKEERPALATRNNSSIAG